MKWNNRSCLSADELTRLRNLKPHELLSVPIDASTAVIKSAYRRLVKVYHPDKSDPFMRKHNEQVVKLINEAYKTLIENNYKTNL